MEELKLLKKRVNVGLVRLEQTILGEKVVVKEFPIKSSLKKSIILRDKLAEKVLRQQARSSEKKEKRQYYKEKFVDDDPYDFRGSNSHLVFDEPVQTVHNMQVLRIPLFSSVLFEEEKRKPNILSIGEFEMLKDCSLNFEEDE